MSAPSLKGVDHKGQVGVNRSALSAYGTLRRMSSFPRLNKIAQMRLLSERSPASHCTLAFQPCPSKTSIAVASWEGLIKTDKWKPGSWYIKVTTAKEHASKMSWELQRVLRPPWQTSGPPQPDLQYPPLFDEAELDNYFARMKKGAQCEKSVLLWGKG